MGRSEWFDVGIDRDLKHSGHCATTGRFIAMGRGIAVPARAPRESDPERRLSGMVPAVPGRSFINANRRDATALIATAFCDAVFVCHYCTILIFTQLCYDLVC